MFAATRRARSQLDRVVEGLPSGWVALVDDCGWFVVGPTGAFALAAGDPDVVTAGRNVARAAAGMRATLAAETSWAPFVDALVVVDGPTPALDAATIVPTRLLADVLTAGPPVLQPEQVARIVSVLS
jgi:hypothetical protein